MSIAFIYSSNSQLGIWYVFAACLITPAFIFCEVDTGGDLGDRNNVELIFLPLTILGRPWVCSRGRGVRSPRVVYQNMCISKHTWECQSESWCVCVRGGGRGSRRLVDFQPSLKVSLNWHPHLRTTVLRRIQGTHSVKVGFLMPKGMRESSLFNIY